MRIKSALACQSTWQTLTITLSILLLTSSAFAGPDLDRLAKQATSTDKQQADTAIKALRDAGPKGLQALLHTYQQEVEEDASAPPNLIKLELGVLTPGATPPPESERKEQRSADWQKVKERPEAEHPGEKGDETEEDRWSRISHAIDQVAAQKDAYASGLYWYTDWDAAVAAAKEQDKPILSLRLLGRLDEDYSCANSRFFRTALYPNALVKKLLSEDFILYWQSLRPVPRITIEMGDGRKIERTITGNSIHYVLDADGRILDAIPGMYAPRTFVEILTTAKRLHGMNLSDETLARYQADMAQRLASRWTRALAKRGVADATAALPGNQTWPTDQQYSYAARANELAPSKARVEQPFFAALEGQRLQQLTDDALWTKLAGEYQNASQLDPASRSLMRQKLDGRLPAADANQLAISKSFVEDPFMRNRARFSAKHRPRHRVQ